MTVAATILEAIELLSREGIESVTVGNQTVTKKNIAELIKASEFLSAQTAAAQPHFGLRITQLIPPGTG